MYNIEMKFTDGEGTIALDYDSFKVAKNCLKNISEGIIEDQDYYIEQGIQVRMTDTHNPPRLYHYITAKHPGVSLPSRRL